MNYPQIVQMPRYVSHVEGFKNIVVGSFPGRLQELQNLCGNIEVVRYTSYCKCNTT